jgi:hypothetical protein
MHAAKRTRVARPTLSVRGWLWPALLALLGVVVALVLGGVYERVASGGARATWLVAEVSAERRFTQEFPVTRDRLVGVQLLLLRSGLRPELNNELVTVRLHTATRPGPDLAVASLPLGALNTDQPTEFRFPPFSPTVPASALSTTLVVVVEAPTLPANSGLMLGAASRNAYDGVLRINDQRFARFDLALTPVYEPLIGDRLLPLSRMALGKPGVLGWPPFYLMLMFAYVWAFVVAASWLYRRARVGVAAIEPDGV